MSGSDKEFEGDQGRVWIRAIGKYGDVVRMAIVNPIVAEVLDYFVGVSPSGLLQPHKIIQSALLSVSKVLNSAGQGDPLGQHLRAWHDSDHPQKFRNLAKACLWDLGCGEGYLGRWLSAYGTSYLGIDRSSTLCENANSYEKSPRVEVINDCIEHFFAEMPEKPEPTLVSLIGVLEHCEDPAATLRRVHSFLSIKRLSPKPILIATFDPDFYTRGLPQLNRAKSAITAYEWKQNLSLMDPAKWELLFANNGFHVLEQRPVHLNQLPLSLIESLQALSIGLFSDRSYWVPPRQGPFYFWLLAPKRTPKTTGNQYVLGRRGTRDGMETSYRKGDVIEIVGNLGSAIYTVVEGEAKLECELPGLEPMLFRTKRTFGQMELSQNYVASRMLGSIVAATTNATLDALPLSEVGSALDKDNDFLHKLFVGMLSHLDSIQFKRFISSRKTGSNDAKVITAAPAQIMRNCAAALLQQCADQNHGSDQSRYMSRIVVELNMAKAEGRTRARPLTEAAPRKSVTTEEVIRQFVEQGVIDCFSAPILKQATEIRDGIVTKPFQDDIQRYADNELREGTILHIGLIAAVYLEQKLACKRKERYDLGLLGATISAMLGYEWDENYVTTKRLKESDAASDDGKKKITVPATHRQFREIALAELGGGDPNWAERPEKAIAQRFLIKTRSIFNADQNSTSETHYGLSSLVVVRDVWALFACLLDDVRMWEGGQAVPNSSSSRSSDYARRAEQRHRLIAYFYDCMEYIGAEAGFTT